MKIEELIKDLDPVTIIEFKNYVIENLSELCKIKNSNSKIISNHRCDEIICKHCKGKMNKNGKTKNEVQKYICKHCGYTCSETTDTIVAHSHLSFDVWSNVIDNLLDGFSIRRIAEENNISICTSFRLRHKILLALKKYVQSIKLNAIPSGKHSNGEINISKINGIHSQLETWLSRFRGVSIRHLQEYLDWFVFIFTMKRKFSLTRVKTESYNTVIIDNNYIKSKDIFKIPLPIDLKVAYSEYSRQS